MIDEEKKNKIMINLSAPCLASGGGWPSQADWDRYFEEHYKGCKIETLEKDEDFMLYEIREDEVFIKDIIAFKHAFSFFIKVMKLAKSLDKKVVVNLHLSSFDLLNVLIKRFEFKIVELLGIHYKLERRW